MAANTYIGIPRDITFPIEVGGNTLIGLQKLILFIMENKTEEEIKYAHECILKNEYPEEWVEHFAFLSFFIKILEQTAINKGIAIEEKLDETTNPLGD